MNILNICYIMNQHFYINLEHRKQRNQETITELRKLGIKKPNRFNAITHEIPILGCAKSHMEVIKRAKELKWSYVIIFEDDLKIENKKKVLEKFNKYINTDFDVLYLGAWNYTKPIQLTNDLAKVTHAVCNHAYIVKQHYYDTLIQNLQEGIELKLKNDLKENNNDEYHHKLQVKDNWFCVTPIYITQKDGWSDNFKEQRNFSQRIKHIPR